MPGKPESTIKLYFLVYLMFFFNKTKLVESDFGAITMHFIITRSSVSARSCLMPVIWPLALCEGTCGAEHVAFQRDQHLPHFCPRLNLSSSSSPSPSVSLHLISLSKPSVSRDKMAQYVWSNIHSFLQPRPFLPACTLSLCSAGKPLVVFIALPDCASCSISCFGCIDDLQIWPVCYFQGYWGE